MNVSEISPQEISESVEATAHDLRDLTSQSWNLELLVSGAALFATLSLPDLSDSVLVYYRYNLMSDADYVHDVVPSQIVGLIKGVTYLLFTAFLIHFIMRAFWVGLVGLLAVYPEGIDYDKIQYVGHNPQLAPFSFRLSQRFSLLFLGLYRPLLYIMYTFYSQLPKPMLTRRLIWVIALFVVTELVFMTTQLMQTLGASDLLDRRSFITLRDPTRVANANAYDNLRPPDQLIDAARIQADVIREPYVRLFVSYPKSLDVELAKRFQEPKWPDSLARKARRERRAAWYLQTFETYFGVYLNDSLCRSPGFLFTQRADNGRRGLTTVLLADNLKPGRNLLRMTVPDSGKTTKSYYQIPF